MLSSSSKFRKRWPLVYAFLRVQLSVAIGWLVGSIFGHLISPSLTWRSAWHNLIIVEIALSGAMLLGMGIGAIIFHWQGRKYK